MSRTIDTVISCGFMKQYDILFFDIVISPFNPRGLGAYLECKQCFDGVVRDAHGNAVELRNVLWLSYSGGTGSYIINSRSTRKLLSVYEQVLAAGVNDPVDLVIRDKGKAEGLRVGVLFPFITTGPIDGLDPAIMGRERDSLSVYAVELLRHSFLLIAISAGSSNLRGSPWRLRSTMVPTRMSSWSNVCRNSSGATNFASFDRAGRPAAH